MSTGLIVLVAIVAILGTATAASAQTAIASGERPFQFEQTSALAAWRSRATSTTRFHGASPTFGCRSTGSPRTAHSSRPPRAGSRETSPPVVGAAISQTFDKVTLEVPAAQAP